MRICRDPSNLQESPKDLSRMAKESNELSVMSQFRRRARERERECVKSIPLSSSKISVFDPQYLLAN